MNKSITPKWTATTDRPESSYGRPVYVADCEVHGPDTAHSLEEALGCGLLRDVRSARGLTQVEAADTIGGETWPTQHAYSQWENGLRCPRTGPYRDALEEWLLNGAKEQNDTKK